MQILFSGAIANRVHFRGAIALLGVFDTDKGEIVHQTRYHPPPELHAPGQKVQFTGFHFHRGRLYVCTHNAVLVYEDWPPSRPAHVITLPGFNDLHHCLHWQGRLAVANTGLETVDLLGDDLALEQRWDLLRGETGAREIDPQRDVRLIPDTKPHRQHPNHLFEMDGALWVTRLQTRDAVRVDDPSRRLEFSEGLPHDGTRIGDEHVFTTTNGHVIRIDPEGRRPRRVARLGRFDPFFSELGWCRGVCADPADPDRLFVAFSMVRRPRWREIGYRIKHLHQAPPSRICHFDLAEGRLLAAWQVGPDRGHVLFQLQPLDDDRRV